MAKSEQQSNQGKKMEYKRVSFDINEIVPDAPAGEWKASIPRGKCKTQPTKDDHFPMIIAPIRLDSTEEEGETFERALGTELSVFLVFGAKTSRGERLSKLRIRQVCEALDIDLDLIPKVINDGDDLQPLVRALEGKKFTVWTRLQTRKDTGEVTSEVLFQDPNRTLSAASDDGDDEDDDDEPQSEPAPKKKPAASKNSNGKKK
jgi:hypothetical protein